MRRLSRRLEGTATTVSLPSLRVDAFSIDMARLATTGKKSGLTFAPEAGTQRLRDVINKNVTEEELLRTVDYAFQGGWRRVKLYFMIGLPTETDEDVRGIGELVGRVLERARAATPKEQRGSIRVGRLGLDVRAQGTHAVPVGRADPSTRRSSVVRPCFARASRARVSISRGTIATSRFWRPSGEGRTRSSLR